MQSETHGENSTQKDLLDVISYYHSYFRSAVTGNRTVGMDDGLGGFGLTTHAP